MSKTIAEKLIVLSDGLALIDQERNYQTELILNLQDTIEELATPIPQTAPLISIDNTAGTITATVIQEQGGYVPMGTLNTTITAKHSIDTLLPGNIKAGVNILGVTGTMSSGIDTSDATAAAGDILSGKTAYVNGTKVTGNIATKTSSNLTASGATVTVPAGYYASNASKSITSGSATTPTTVITATPSLSTTYTYDKSGYKMSVSKTQSVTPTVSAGYVSAGTAGNITVSGEAYVPASAVNAAVTSTNATAAGTIGYNQQITVGAGYCPNDRIIRSNIASGSATTPATTITSAPTISVDANGLITASNSKTQNVTPTVSAGYVSSGTAGTITVSGSNTRQLVTKGAATYTPSTTNQTIQSGQYLTGAQTIAGDADLTAANIRNGVNIFGVTGTYTSDATADATMILKDKIAYSKGSKITGTMANNGAVAPSALGAGGSYTIPAGYHNGSGKVTAASLAGQTPADATAGLIANGKTAWVNGSKITGTMTELTEISPNSVASVFVETWSPTSGVTVPVVKLTSTANLSSGYITPYTKLTTFTTLGVFGDATPNQVLAGKTFTSNSGVKTTGTMTNQGAKTVSLNTSTTSYTIPAGYHNGSGKVSVTLEQKTVTPSASQQNITPSSGKVLSKVTVNTDTNLKAENIKNGVTIFGVTGTYSSGGNSSNITDLTNTTWLFQYHLDEYWRYGAGFPWNLNFTSNNTNYTQIRYEDNSDDSNDRREMYYNNDCAYGYDTGLHRWWGDDMRTIHITGGADVKNANVIADLQKMATLVDSNDLEALGALCDWTVMTDGSSYPVVCIYNRHPTYYLKCEMYDDNGGVLEWDDGNGNVSGDTITVSPDDCATFYIDEPLSGNMVYIDNVRWTRNA